MEAVTESALPICKGDDMWWRWVNARSTVEPLDASPEKLRMVLCLQLFMARVCVVLVNTSSMQERRYVWAAPAWKAGQRCCASETRTLCCAAQ